MRDLFLTALTAIGLVAGAAPAATLVTNGSFEDLGGQGLNAGNWGNLPSIPGWNGASGTGIEIQTNPTLSSIDAEDGSNYVELDTTSNSSMYQDLLLQAGSYEFSFWFSPRIDTTGLPTTNMISYDISGLTSLLSGSVDGPSSTVPFGAWTEFSRLFTVSQGGVYRLSFFADGASDSLGGLIDNVSVAPVPLPAAGLLLLASIGGLAAFRRRGHKLD